MPNPRQPVHPTRLRLHQLASRLASPLALAHLSTALLFSLLTPGAASADAADGVRNLLLGRTATFKIEMPILKGVVLTPEGRLEEKTYYKRLKKHRPAFRPGERAEIRKVQIKDNQLEICFNGCGMSFLGPGSRVLGKTARIGSAILISYPAAPMSADLDPQRVLEVISGVVTVEGAMPDTRSLPGRPATDEVRREEPRPEEPRQAAPASAELLSVAIEPPEARAGDTVSLVMVFEVENAAAAGLPLTEERQMFHDDTPLFSTARATTATWHNGRQTTRVSLEIPASAAPGAYVFEGVLRGAGKEQTKRAVALIHP